MFTSFYTGVLSLLKFSLSLGTTRTRVWALAPTGLLALTGVVSGQSIIVPGASVGQNLQTSLTISISVAAPVGGLSVKVTSSDPSKLLVAGRQIDLGTQQTTFVIPGGESTISGIYLQGLVNTGTVTITASAPGYQSGMATITLTPSGFLMTGPGGASFTTNAGAASSTLTLTAARLDSSFNFAETQQVRGGFSASVNVTNTNPSAGTVGTPVSFAAGDGSATTLFTPGSAGNTTLTAVAPAGFSTPASGNSVAVTVNPATLMPSNVTVGKNLETTAHVTGAASGLQITVTSNNTSLVLLACLTAAPSCTGTAPNGAGAASITVTVPNGQNVSPDFYVYGVADTGTATYTASASGIVPGTGTVTLAKSGFVIAGPAGIGQPSFVPLTTSTDINVFGAVLDASGNFVATQAVAGNLSVNVNVTSSNTAVGTISMSPVTITGGSFGATTQFIKGGGGSSDLTVSTPAGFTTPTALYTKVTANVLTISFALPCDGGTIGQNLQADCTVAIGQPAPAGGVPVTITSNNSSLLLLSATPTGAGSPFITVTIPAGATSTSYVAQALAGSGTVTHTASSSGFSNRTAMSTLAPSGVIIAGPGGLGTPFFSATVSGGPVPVNVLTAVLNPANNSFLGTESLRGGAPSVQVTLTSTNTVVGTIASPVTITGGSGGAVAQFTPLSGGSTTVLVGTPAGFTTSSNDKSLSVSVTGSAVGPPSITKAFGAATIPLSGSTSLSFTVTNPSTTALTATSFTDALPAGLVVATPNGLTATCTGTISATAGSGTVTLTG
ncbi:MAG: hypothetical protein M3Y27_24375, partial [Acidobacteriota bacterium]|nr:hypothetical protein [Acidobacteriota bacterium]